MIRCIHAKNKERKGQLKEKHEGRTSENTKIRGLWDQLGLKIALNHKLNVLADF
jgi:hypothetical protein